MHMVGESLPISRQRDVQSGKRWTNEVWLFVLRLQEPLKGV